MRIRAVVADYLRVLAQRIEGNSYQEQALDVTKIDPRLLSDYRSIALAWPDIVEEYSIPPTVANPISRAIAGLTFVWYCGMPDEVAHRGKIKDSTVSQFIIDMQINKWRIRNFGTTRRMRLLSLLTEA